MLAPLRRAARSLLHSPGYTSIALLTLALGIGVNTSMFSLVDALLFRQVPFPAAHRLVQVLPTTGQGETRSFSYLELQEVREAQPAFSALTTLMRTHFGISEPGQPAERIAATTVSEDFFATFDVRPMLGRAFTAEEHQPGRNQVVLLSHAYWQQQFGGVPDVLGRTLRLDGQVVTIIGVMPPEFDHRPLWGSSALWRPLNFTAYQKQWRDYRAFELIGRVRPEATAGRLSAELASVAARQARQFPESYSALTYNVVPLHEALRDELGQRISWMLLGLSSLVLLIACANLANLQLARAAGDVRGLAIRAALGASRRRLVGQQLAESLLLALSGGAVGILLALGVNEVIERSLAIDDLHLGLDGRVLLLAAVVSLFTGVSFGIAPAWFASRTNLNATLKQQSRGSSAGRGQHRVRQMLIIAETALALVLLGGAAILHRGLAQLLERSVGWDTAHVITAALPIPETRPEYQTDAQRIELFRKLEDRLTTLPGVEHAALATSLPIFSYSADRQVLKDGQSPGEPNLPTAFHVMVSADYFAALGIPLIEGRLFERAIKSDDPSVVIVNESFARRMWPNQRAVGQRLAGMDSGKPYWAEVIGVVRDVDVAANTREPATPFQVYKPLAQEPWSFVHVVLRGPAPAGLGETLRRAIAEVDPDLAAAGIGTVQQLADAQQRNLVIASRTLSGFALLGLLLAALGLYGVIANLVTQRTGEFGIRLALGARPADVLGLVLRHGLALCAAGTILGLAGAWALGHALAAWMPRVAGFDGVALLAVTGVLFAAALTASWIPARRATKVDPMVALRAE